MKFYLIIYFAFITQIIFSQSNFERGFDNGFKNGYCFDDYGCIAPFTPFAPIPLLNESYENYNQGYNRGFTVGQRMKTIDITSAKQNNSNTWGVATKFPEQNLYHPDNNYLMSVYSQAQQNYHAQQNYQAQQNYKHDLQIEKLKKEAEETIKKYKSPEARKKRYDDFVYYKNKYNAFKFKPNELEDNWYKVVIYYGNIFGNIPENPSTCQEKWVYLRNNIVVVKTDSPDNFKNSNDTEYYYPEEERDSFKKYMIDNAIQYDVIIDKSYSTYQGAARIETAAFINENGFIKELVDNSEDYSKRGVSVIFFDYMDQYEKKQISINLDKKPINNSNSKVKTPKSTKSKLKKITKEVKTTFTNEVF